jgi:hypothetical protein
MLNTMRIGMRLLLGPCFLSMISRFHGCFRDSSGRLRLSFSSLDRIELCRQSAFSLSCPSRYLLLGRIGSLLMGR